MASAGLPKGVCALPRWEGFCVLAGDPGTSEPQPFNKNGVPSKPFCKVKSCRFEGSKKETPGAFAFARRPKTPAASHPAALAPGTKMAPLRHWCPSAAFYRKDTKRTPPQCWRSNRFERLRTTCLKDHLICNCHQNSQLEPLARDLHGCKSLGSFLICREGDDAVPSQRLNGSPPSCPWMQTYFCGSTKPYGHSHQAKKLDIGHGQLFQGMCQPTPKKKYTSIGPR